MSLRFPVVKLLDFRKRWEDLEESHNPFAVVTMAHLLTLETAKDPARRLARKLWMVRRLRQVGLSQEEREELFGLIDWFMGLPEDLQLQFDEELEREEGKVPYVTSFERRAEERGLQKGLQKGLEEGHQEGLREGLQEGQALLLSYLLERKFGPLSEEQRRRVAGADPGTIREWSERVLTAERLQDVLD